MNNAYGNSILHTKAESKLFLSREIIDYHSRNTE